MMLAAYNQIIETGVKTFYSSDKLFLYSTILFPYTVNMYTYVLFTSMYRSINDAIQDNPQVDLELKSIYELRYG